MAGAKGKYKDLAPLVLKYISEGASNKDAAEKAGIDESTFYEWLNTKPEFSKSVKDAQRQGDLVRVNSVEAALLDIARGFEYEEVKTEYESQLNPKTGKYEPTIKKQVRTKKRVVPQTEAIKFYLTNKVPEEWKNRQEHDIPNLEFLQGFKVERVGSNDDEGIELNPTEY